jgi:hypothetical protein
MLCAEELVARLLGAPANTADGHSDRVGEQTGSTLAVELQVKLDLRTLAGLQSEPIEIDGVTNVADEVLRRWLLEVPDIRFRRLITDPETQAVLDCGTSTYVPTAALRRFLVVRDGHCLWDGCEAPAVTCDIDHAVPWDQGGRTDRDNLNVFCRSHHLLKTFAGYRLERGLTGDWLLVTPTGEIFGVAGAVCQTSDPDPPPAQPN